MTFAFEHLDARTRPLMTQELERDLADDTMYYSPRLLEAHHEDWVRLLRDAFASHDEDWLAAGLRARGWLREKESYTLSGVERERRVPSYAHEMIAHGAFNHYYIRAVCARAAQDGLEVEIYRAKEVSSPRAESEARVGERLDPAQTLETLRSLHEDDVTLPVPSGPNSGLSVRARARA